MKHEPPWKAAYVANHWEVTTDRDDPSDEYDVNEDPDEATARLEAAAPDYFAAVERMLSNFEEAGHDCGGEWIEGLIMLQAAHAKAKGD